jgi:hypothetical protein
MEIQNVKIEVILKIMHLNQIDLLNKIDKILDEEAYVGFTNNGKPLTFKEYNSRLQLAEKQIQSGNGISQENLESEIESW